MTADQVWSLLVPAFYGFVAAWMVLRLLTPKKKKSLLSNDEKLNLLAVRRRCLADEWKESEVQKDGE